MSKLLLLFFLKIKIYQDLQYIGYLNILYIKKLQLLKNLFYIALIYIKKSFVFYSGIRCCNFVTYFNGFIYTTI